MVGIVAGEKGDRPATLSTPQATLDIKLAMIVLELRVPDGVAVGVFRFADGNRCISR